MKEFLRGNDISVAWTLPVLSDNSRYSGGHLYVYGGVSRMELESSVSGNELTGVVKGVLPAGYYTLEYVYSYKEAGVSAVTYRRLKKGNCFAVTEDGDDVGDFDLALS